MFHIDTKVDHTSHNVQNDMQKYLGSSDEVINKTLWKPLAGGGQSFKSHTMKKEGEYRLVFDRSFTAILFNVMFVIFGLILIFLSLFGRTIGMSSSGNPFYSVAVGILFMGVGVFLHKKGISRDTMYAITDKAAAGEF